MRGFVMRRVGRTLRRSVQCLLLLSDTLRPGGPLGARRHRPFGGCCRSCASAWCRCRPASPTRFTPLGASGRSGRHHRLHGLSAGSRPPEAQRRRRGQSFAGEDCGACIPTWCWRCRTSTARRPSPAWSGSAFRFSCSTPAICRISIARVATVGRILGQRAGGDGAGRRTAFAREPRYAPSQQARRKPSVLLVLSIDPLITAGRNAFITRDDCGSRERAR